MSGQPTQEVQDYLTKIGFTRTRSSSPIMWQVKKNDFLYAIDFVGGRTTFCNIENYEDGQSPVIKTLFTGMAVDKLSDLIFLFQQQLYGSYIIGVSHFDETQKVACTSFTSG